MPVERINDLQAFKGFVDEQLSNGGAGLTLDEALARWEHENSSKEERDETIEAIQRGLNDMYAGRTVDALEFAEQMREKYRTAAKP